MVTECMIALAVVTVLVTTAMGTLGAQGRGTVLAQDALRVRLAATSRLETAPSRPLAPGRRAFDAGSPGLSGEEEVREVAPGLLEVAVRVRAASGARAEFTGRVATAERKP
jgi:hypothetical protein